MPNLTIRANYEDNYYFILCREIAKLDNPESREERRQEMEKIKSAR